jgi:LacI family transcriptional regulator
VRDGVAHLIAHGHRRIGFIGDQPGIHTAAERLRGYREAMAAAGLPVRDDWYAMGPTTPDRVRASLDHMLSGPEPVTALLAGNNRVTVTAVRVLSGLPRPIALVGFDDFELADLLSPPVTVVAQDAPGLGRTAAQLLFRRLDGMAGDDPTRTELPARLIPRGSGEIPPAT